MPVSLHIWVAVAEFLKKIFNWFAQSENTIYLLYAGIAFIILLLLRIWPQSDRAEIDFDPSSKNSFLIQSPTEEKKFTIALVAICIILIAVMIFFITTLSGKISS